MGQRTLVGYIQIGSILQYSNQQSFAIKPNSGKYLLSNDRYFFYDLGLNSAEGNPG